MPRPASRNGFTLMELLIVIAIIGILAGMLFPAVGYVREKARKDECLNNLRQWGMALQGYLDEHRGVFPSYGAASAGGPVSLDEAGAWFNVLPPYIGVEALKDFKTTPHPGFGIKTPFLCPSDRITMDEDDIADKKKNGWREYYSSYAPNAWIDNAANSATFSKRLRASQLNSQHEPPVSPASFVVFAETGEGDKGGADLSTLTEQAFRHARSMNLCFADGHVENASINDVWEPGLAAAANYGGLQWNPNNADLTGSSK